MDLARESRGAEQVIRMIMRNVEPSHRLAEFGRISHHLKRIGQGILGIDDDEFIVSLDDMAVDAPTRTNRCREPYKYGRGHCRGGSN